MRSLRIRAAALAVLIFANALCVAGAPVVSAAPAPVAPWTKEHALPLTRVEAGGGFEDLRALGDRIGDARIVALGEATHGTREIFQLKHRLVEYLVAERGFTLFAIEANMPEAQRVNGYIVEGRGDAAELIRGMYFWTWETEEVREIVEWMRRFNADPANRTAGKRVGFTGFDMQYPEVPASIVRDYVKDHAPDLLPDVEGARSLLPRVGKGGAGGFGAATGDFPVEAARGHRVVLSGWIRTEKVSEGWAGLWCRVDTSAQVAAAFDNMKETGPRGTTPWTRYEIALEVPADAKKINYGALLTGDGTAWFDALEITLDGKPYAESAALDLDFETSPTTALPYQSSGAFVVRRSEEAHQGKYSMRITKTGAARDTRPEAQQRWQECEARLRKLPAPSTPDDATAHVWALQNARIVAQALRSDEPYSRDRAMAENVAWLLEQNPKAKIILWAHNGHIARAEHAMGSHLQKQFGNAMCVVGFALGEGRYRAVARGRKGLTDHPLAPPEADSFEAVFAATKLETFALDLRELRSAPRNVANWFSARHPHRLIGAMEMTEQFGDRSLVTDYDIVLWLAHTTAAVPLAQPNPGAK